MLSTTLSNSKRKFAKTTFPQLPNSSRSVQLPSLTKTIAPLNMVDKNDAQYCIRITLNVHEEIMLPEEVQSPFEQYKP
jgi:hypothetical protein